MPVLGALGGASARALGRGTSVAVASGGGGGGGGGGAGGFISVNDVFSTTLYTGTGGAQTINNGIDLSGQGGLVWLKARSRSQSHGLFDTTRGENPYLCTDLTDGQFNYSNGVVYNTNGFTNKANSFFGGSGDGSGLTYASWTFRRSTRFFDVVTWTGDGVAGREIPHSLGSAPGCIIIKATSVGGTPAGWIVPADWWVYHRGLPSSTNFSLRLNTTAGQDNSGGLVASASTFTIYGSTAASNMPNNVSGVTYIAYLYAHDAALDGIIQCGSVTDTTSTSATVNLGWEPQWIMLKKITTGGGNQALNDDWYIVDNKRGFSSALLYPNLAAVEGSQGFSPMSTTSTGFIVNGAIDQTDTFIYIAIRGTTGAGQQGAGQQAYTTPGTYSWVAPAGVTSVSVVAIGGFTESFFINASTVRGGGGSGGPGTFTGDGGGNGGNAGAASPNSSGYWAGGGGGGAGGYTSAGGNGGNGTGNAGIAGHSRGAPGGGTGIFGGALGGSGGAGGVGDTAPSVGGAGGSGGTAGTSDGSGGTGGNYGGGAGYLTSIGASYGGGLGWKNNIAVTPGSSYTVQVGGTGTDTNAGVHAGGAVRIIWGAGRAFPSTNTGDL